MKHAASRCQLDGRCEFSQQEDPAATVLFDVDVTLSCRAFPISMLFVLASGVAQQSPSPAQQPQFRTQANVVMVPAPVKDKNGAIVYGLEAKDFIIEDDGIEQPVQLDEEPPSAPISLVVAIQVGRTAAAELPRMRTLGTMLDPILRQGRTRAAIVTFDGAVELTRGFTTNGALIVADLNQLRSGDNKAAILDDVGYSVALLKQEPPERSHVLLLVSETRDHGSHVVTFEDRIPNGGLCQPSAQQVPAEL